MLTTKIDAAGHWLRADAAASYARMIADGMPLGGVAAAGRTWGQQAILYALYRAGRGNLAARPGTSLHESGIALDMTRGTPAQRWMTVGGDPWKVTPTGSIRANEYGWSRTVPSEAWHFSYNPTRDKHKGATTMSQSTTPLPTLARVASFNCGAWGKTSMTGKQIDGLVGVLLTLSASIYCLTECPEWLRNHFRGLCKCPADAHRRLSGGASRWLVRVRGSQVILRDSRKWASGPYDSDEFGPTSYHGWLWETLTQPTTRATLTVGCYHLPPNVVASQTFQRDGLRAFLAKVPAGAARLVGGDGADSSEWFTGWADARTAAKASANRDAPTYKTTIRDRIHTRGITVRRYTVVSSGGASDHNAVLTQITIPAGADPSL